MSIECDYWQEKMSLWLDGELEPDQYQELENHVTICAECSAVFSIMQQVDSLLSTTPMVFPPPDFSVGFQTKLAAHRRSRTWAGFLILALSVSAGLGIIGLLVVFSGLVLWQESSLADLLGTAIGIIFITGQAVGSMIDVFLVVIRSMEHVVRHPVFLTYAFGTMALALLWAGCLRRLVWAPQTASARIRGS